MSTGDLRALLRRHEGFRSKVYKDTTGRWTLGYGRNVQDVGITREEAGMLLENDITRISRELRHALPWVTKLDEVRAAALIDMAFMGVGSLLTFKRFLAALEVGDYDTAADEMLDSLWASQVNGRALELAAMIRTGRYDNGA
ncbi:MAG: hypothetical protein WC485_12420 [Opitutaceae bacterium]